MREGLQDPVLLWQSVQEHAALLAAHGACPGGGPFSSHLSVTCPASPPSFVHLSSAIAPTCCPSAFALRHHHCSAERHTAMAAAFSSASSFDLRSVSNGETFGQHALLRSATDASMHARWRSTIRRQLMIESVQCIGIEEAHDGRQEAQCTLLVHTASLDGQSQAQEQRNASQQGTSTTDAIATQVVERSLTDVIELSERLLSSFDVLLGISRGGPAPLSKNSILVNKRGRLWSMHGRRCASARHLLASVMRRSASVSDDDRVLRRSNTMQSDQVCKSAQKAALDDFFRCALSTGGDVVASSRAMQDFLCISTVCAEAVAVTDHSSLFFPRSLAEPTLNTRNSISMTVKGSTSTSVQCGFEDSFVTSSLNTSPQDVAISYKGADDNTSYMPDSRGSEEKNKSSFSLWLKTSTPRKGKCYREDSNMAASKQNELGQQQCKPDQRSYQSVSLTEIEWKSKENVETVSLSAKSPSATTRPAAMLYASSETDINSAKVATTMLDGSTGRKDSSSAVKGSTVMLRGHRGGQVKAPQVAVAIGMSSWRTFQDNNAALEWLSVDTSRSPSIASADSDAVEHLAGETEISLSQGHLKGLANAVPVHCSESVLRRAISTPNIRGGDNQDSFMSRTVHHAGKQDQPRRGCTVDRREVRPTQQNGADPPKLTMCLTDRAQSPHSNNWTTRRRIKCNTIECGTSSVPLPSTRAHKQHDASNLRSSQDSIVDPQLVTVASC